MAREANMAGLALLAKKSAWSLLNLLRQLKNESLFRLLFTLGFCIFLFWGLWELFAGGFRFLSNLGGMGLMVIHRLFALFFFGMGILLALSSIISSYATLYRSEEVPFLLLRPFSRGTVIVYKFFESALLSSWSFLFLIVPFVGAYAMHERLPPLFSLWTLVFSLPFVLICAGIGSLATMLLVRYVPRTRAVLWVVAAAGIASALAVWQRGAPDAEALNDTQVVLTRLIPGLKTAMYPLWPSWWVSEGIMALSRGDLGRGTMFLVLLLSTAGVVTMLVEGTGRRLFFDGWLRDATSFQTRGRSSRWLDVIDRALGFLPQAWRSIVAKDIRVFFRDTVQWSQVLIFFGILGIYFLNIRNFNYHTMPDHWRNLIAFLNVFSVSAVMCSCGARFIFPQLSLEGHGFWVLGMSPVSMGRILLLKFGMAALGLTALSFGLMFISVEMLEVEAEAKAVALLLGVCMAVAIAALSSGLGAVFMDLKQQNPAAIISGFGGTLNLVLSLGYMMAVIIPFGFIFHARFMGRLQGTAFQQGLGVCLGWLLLLTLLAVWLPLQQGRRSLMRREF